METIKILEQFEQNFNKSWDDILEKKLQLSSPENIQSFQSIIEQYNVPFPKWVERCIEECMKIFVPFWKNEFRVEVFKSLDDEKSELNLSSYEYGLLMGSLLKVLDKSIKQIQSEAFLKSPLAFLKDFDFEKHTATLKKIFLHTVGEKDHTQQEELMAGYFKGSTETVDQHGNLRGELQNFNLYFVLFLLWPFILKLKSIRELYEGVKGRLYHGDYDSFRKVCLRLGIKLNVSGRPKKIGTLPPPCAVSIKKSTSMRKSPHAKPRSLKSSRAQAGRHPRGSGKSLGR